MKRMRFVYDDGGRKAAGYQGTTGDCVARAVAIATGEPYQRVYDTLSAGNAGQRQTKRTRASVMRRSAAHGVLVRRKWFKDYMAGLGWEFVATMGIGTGCTVHLAAGELPPGRLVVSVSRHYTAVVDGVIHDLYDPQRDPQHVYGGTPVNGRNPIVQTIGGRCVYGYWRARR